MHAACAYRWKRHAADRLHSQVVRWHGTQPSALAAAVLLYGLERAAWLGEAEMVRCPAGGGGTVYHAMQQSPITLFATVLMTTS